MKKISISLIVLIFACGCTGNYFTGKHKSTHRESYLEGLTMTSIFVRFGAPDSKETSYDFDQRIETWHYYFKFKPSLHIEFSDGYVSRGSYY